MRVAKAQEFERIFAIMEQSFPRDEHRGRAGQRAIWNDPRYCVYVEEEGAQLCAFIALWHLEGYTFVEHFAVAPAFRNKGLGGRMLSALKRKADTPLCLEVELPDNDLARRRIAFYEKHGFTYNDYPYAQPAFSPTQSPVPLRLMTTNAPLTESEFLTLKNLIYKEIYKIW